MGNVVIADMVSVRDPDDGATRREDSLVTAAEAFGVAVDETTTKAALAKALTGQTEDAESAEDRETARSERDRRQLGARETEVGGEKAVPSSLDRSGDAEATSG